MNWNAICTNSLQFARDSDFQWLLGRKFYVQNAAGESASPNSDLTWSAYNSVTIIFAERKTTISMFPILDRTPTDYSVQWTVMNQFKDVKKQLAATEEKTVITVDLGL